MTYNIQRFSFQNSGSDIQQAVNSALLWRFNAAARLTSLVNQKATWYATNYSEFWYNWYFDVFNLATATPFGLAVWAIILNLPIEVEDEIDPPGKPIWGFGPDVGRWSPGYALNFEHSNFSNKTHPQLNTDEKRFLLRVRYFQLQSRGSMLEINRFLPKIINGIAYGSGTLFVFDNLDMTITYTFTFTPRPVMVEALITYDVLPRPTGVKAVMVFPSLFDFKELDKRLKGKKLYHHEISRNEE